MKAVKENKANECQMYLMSGADPNSRSMEYEETVLMIAASKGNSEILDLLLSKGASVNARDSDGNFAIHLATQEGHLECVKLLIEKGCVTNVGNSGLNTPLMLAAIWGHVNIVNHLLDKGVNMTYTLNANSESELTLAAKYNRLEVVQVLINRADKDIDRSNELNMAYSNALETASNEMVLTLLCAGADVNYYYIAGVPPLFVAVGRENLDFIKTLLEHGADLNGEDDDGYNALLYAVAVDNFDAVKYLISIGADINAMTKEDNLTAIELAENTEDKRILEIIMEALRSQEGQ